MIWLMLKNRLKCKNAIVLMRSALMLIMVFSLLMPSLLSPVLAVDYHANDFNYVDFISTYAIQDDDTVLVTLQNIPYQLTVRNGSVPIASVDNNSVTFHHSGKNTYQVVSLIFASGPSNAFNGLSLSNIPQNSIFSVYYDIQTDFPKGVLKVSYSKPWGYVKYWTNPKESRNEFVQLEQNDSNIFSYQFITDTGYNPDVSISFTGSLDTTLEYAGPSEGPVTISLEKATIKLQISQLQFQAIQDEKSQKLLDDINNNLDEIKEGQKKYNEEILYGDSLDDHNVNGPGGFNNKVDQQGEQAQNGMEEINKIPKPDADTAIPDIVAQVPADGMNFLSNIMAGITGFSIVNDYLLIVVGLFIVSFIMFGKKEG